MSGTRRAMKQRRTKDRHADINEGKNGVHRNRTHLLSLCELFGIIFGSLRPPRLLAATPVAGENNEVLKVAQPTSAPPGKVEVIEFFSWRNPLCYRLEVAIEAFVKKEGDRVLLKRVPVALNLGFPTYSQLYYSLVSLGLAEKLTLTVYHEIFHGKYNMLSEQDQN